MLDECHDDRLLIKDEIMWQNWERFAAVSSEIHRTLVNISPHYYSGLLMESLHQERRRILLQLENMVTIFLGIVKELPSSTIWRRVKLLQTILGGVIGTLRNRASWKTSRIVLQKFEPDRRQPILQIWVPQFISCLQIWKNDLQAGDFLKTKK